jgi:RNA polymerase sigma factor (sigma-70 family)
MNAPSQVLDGLMASDTPSGFATLFRARYASVARVIARVVQDQGRAEDLAVEVFLKLWRNPQAQGEKAGSWLYKAAVRRGLDELRRRTRRKRYEALFGIARRVPTPEDICTSSETQERVRLVLAVLDTRQAELLLLRSHGLSYEELAEALDLNPVSIGTLLSRAQQSFRKEYIKRYGEQ